MPRAEVGTNKWLANKMKSKGLQKLRWYCQMCEKQCRDENGFKCHRMSEGHQRQMQVFSQNAGKFMDEFSRTFEKDFMKLMKTRYCRTRVKANSVYCEVISHKEHVHMNSTVWVTLTSFVQYLVSSGQCKADMTPKGWYLEYIDREKNAREEFENSRRKAEETAEDKQNKRVEHLIEEAKKKGGYQQPEYTPLVRKMVKQVTEGGVKVEEGRGEVVDGADGGREVVCDGDETGEGAECVEFEKICFPNALKPKATASGANRLAASTTKHNVFMDEIHKMKQKDETLNSTTTPDGVKQEERKSTFGFSMGNNNSTNNGSSSSSGRTTVDTTTTTNSSSGSNSRRGGGGVFGSNNRMGNNSGGGSAAVGSAAVGGGSAAGGGRKLSAMEKLMLENEKRKKAKLEQ
eukprot:GHVS01002719.1.p1 GENE.GHVS01002719.1~~GHVS01002719.1.p1  ORF type:complete len:403 (+),score=118.15 GHVS01002719.1:355-1563(+)